MSEAGDVMKKRLRVLVRDVKNSDLPRRGDAKGSPSLQ